MVKGFVFKNMTTEKEAVFGQTVDDNYLWSQIDWGSVPAAHSTYSYPGQVGETISSTKLNTRDVTVTGFVFYVMKKDELATIPRKEWVSYGYERIKLGKAFLNEVVNPNDFIRLTVGDYYIEGKPQSSVVYGKDDSTNNMYFCEFTFALMCANPMFKRISQTKTVLSGEIPMFHFPWILDDSKGYVMSARNAYSLLNVENEGNVPVGGRITLEALGDVVEPMVENVETGEVIKVVKTMHRGEIVVIDTSDGKSKGIRGGIGEPTENYFRYWSKDNTWFKFQQGITMIGYSTGNSSDSLLQVTVEINPEKFNLEEM